MSDVLERLKAALADRYAIEGELGRGGMAVVFLADDLRHGRKVAIKILRPELTSAVAAERFLREIRITAGLAHPHILKLLDSGEADGLVYFVMPYVEGESLRHRLEREGKLPVDEALQITREVADALSHAHSKDVLHRDIKPENILIEAGHAIVADFGIAKALTDAGGDRLTDTGISIGTPIYMSPEQVAGDPKVDARSDIYALACVAYELLAGEPPYTGKTQQAIVAQKMLGEVRPLREVRPDVVPDLEGGLQKALEPDAEDRFSSAAEFSEALESIGARVTYRRVPWFQRAPAARWVRAASLTVVALLAGAVGYWVLLSPEPRAESSKRSVVVAPFVNQTGDPNNDVYCSWAADRISQGLAQSNLVLVVDFTQAFIAERTVRSAGVPLAEEAGVRAFAKETLADIVVAGNVYQQGEELLFQATVNDAKTGEVLFGLDPVVGSAEAPRECIELLRDRVMVALAQSVDPVWTAQPIDPDLMSQPQNFDAYSEYLQAMEAHYIDGDWETAIEHFDKAADLDTMWLWPVFSNFYPYWNLGEIDKADSVLVLASRKRERLSPFERLWLDAEIARQHGDNEAHLRAKRRLAESKPGDITAQLNLAQALIEVNRPKEAVEILEPLRGRLWGWESIYIALGHHLLGEYEEEIQEARRARQVDPEWMSPLRWEARGFAAQGRVEDVHRLIDESLALGSVGRNSSGWVMVRAGAELSWHGYHEAARGVVDRAIAWYSSREGDDAQSTEHRFGLACALIAAGRLDESQALFSELAVELPDEFDLASWFNTVDLHGHLGVLAALRDERERALEIGTWLRELDRPGLLGWNTHWEAAIAAALGEQERAVSLLRRAANEGFVLYYLHGDIIMESLRDYPPFEELIRPKG